MRHLQTEIGPAVYAIGILEGEDHARHAKRALQIVCERHGGIAFLPKTLDEVDAISRAVAHDIRSQYTIGYKPTTPRSQGGYRQVKVDAHTGKHDKLTVRTKSGYYAGAERDGRAVGAFLNSEIGQFCDLKSPGYQIAKLQLPGLTFLGSFLTLIACL